MKTPSPEACPKPSTGDLPDRDLLTSCVHCGFCLEVCPTFKLTGDENNSPRGRLRLWRQEAEGKLEPDSWTDFYTAECVGCLACETACPANVPYGKIFEHVRHDHVDSGRAKPTTVVRIAARLIKSPRLMNLVTLPIRILRRTGLLKHRLMFSGAPAVLKSTSEYAAELVRKHRPTGPTVMLQTGCLMEAMFREINFATVRVLIEHNVRVLVPQNQPCCGAFIEHSGLPGLEQLRQQHPDVYMGHSIDAVVTNSSGCGYSLAKSIGDRVPVRDVLSFLSELPLKTKLKMSSDTVVYVDQPCHMIHGMKSGGIPPRVLDATGYNWKFAPNANDCCGSGGTYNIEKPENSKEILRRKSAFLNDLKERQVILATANHVCMMQWSSARAMGLVNRDYQVRHVIQLLDPSTTFE